MKILGFTHYLPYLGSSASGATVSVHEEIMLNMSKGHVVELYSICHENAYSREVLSRFSNVKSHFKNRYSIDEGSYTVNVIMTEHDSNKNLSDYIASEDPKEIVSAIELIKKIIEDTNPDLVTTSFRDLLVIMAAKSLNVPTRVDFVLGDTSNIVPDYPTEKILPFLKNIYSDTFLTVTSQYMKKKVEALLEQKTYILYTLVNPENVIAKQKKPHYISQMSDGIEKGSLITYLLAANHPGLPFMSVIRGYKNSIFEIKPLKNIKTKLRTNDVRNYYGETKILLVPSLCVESFGRVALEGLLNGIPVLATNLGGLTEIVGNSQYLVDVPDPHTMPSDYFKKVSYHTETVEMFSDMVESLYHNPKSYKTACEQAMEQGHIILKKIQNAYDQLPETIQNFANQMNQNRE